MTTETNPAIPGTSERHGFYIFGPHGESSIGWSYSIDGVFRDMRHLKAGRYWVRFIVSEPGADLGSLTSRGLEDWGFALVHDDRRMTVGTLAGAAKGGGR